MLKRLSVAGLVWLLLLVDAKLRLLIVNVRRIRKRAVANKKKIEPVISCYPKIYLTVAEYKQLQKELFARAVCGDCGLPEQLLLEILKAGESSCHYVID